MKFQPFKMLSDYRHKVLSDIKISTKLKIPMQIKCLPVNHPRRVRIYHPPLAKHRGNFESWIELMKKACPTGYSSIFSSITLFRDKIVFQLIILLIIIQHKNRIPAFPAKAGETPMVFQFFQSNSEKGSFSSFSSRSGHPARSPLLEN